MILTLYTDAGLFSDTLFRLLHQLDPSKPHYMGSPAAGRDGTYFAYGGAGFVLSRGLMKRLMRDSTELSVQYESYAVNDCCGDAALGYAIMNQTGVRLQALYPTFAGDELVGLKVNGERWCTPLLALHRVSPEQMKSLWMWERTRPYDQVCTAVGPPLSLPASMTDSEIQHAFTHSTILDYMVPELNKATTRASWDNFADVVQPEDSPAHSSMSECSSACASDPGCLQYLYSAGTCRFGYFVQMGRSVSDPDLTSGWIMKKVYNLGYLSNADRTSSCTEATWLKPVIAP